MNIVSYYLIPQRRNCAIAIFRPYDWPRTSNLYKRILTPLTVHLGTRKMTAHEIAGVDAECRHCAQAWDSLDGCVEETRTHFPDFYHQVMAPKLERSPHAIKACQAEIDKRQLAHRKKRAEQAAKRQRSKAPHQLQLNP
jgi:hypothetical protein